MTKILLKSVFYVLCKEVLKRSTEMQRSSAHCINVTNIQVIIARLKSDKCSVNCFVNRNVNVNFLHTGAQVFLVSKYWLFLNHSIVEIQCITSCVDVADRLSVKCNMRYS